MAVRAERRDRRVTVRHSLTRPISPAHGTTITVLYVTISILEAM